MADTSSLVFLSTGAISMICSLSVATDASAKEILSKPFCSLVCSPPTAPRFILITFLYLCGGRSE
jgi:hypothetical protein